MALNPSDSAPAARVVAPDLRLQYLPGVGPARAAAFERLGLVTVEDLVRHYPNRYLDARRFVQVSALTPGILLTVSGTVKSAAAVRTRGGRTDFAVSIDDGSGVLGCYFFGQPFLARTLTRGTRVVVSGELDALERRMLNPLFEVVEDETERLLHAGRLVPLHGLTRGLTARMMRKVVRGALDRGGGRLPDPLPDATRQALGLEPLAAALENIHFPADDAHHARAHRRLVFEELFLLQMVLELRRHALTVEARGLVTAGPGELAGRAIRSLPFTLTADQVGALGEIVADMRRMHPMQRLLLGDVGSGKTVVAFLAALHALEAGHQAAFMAPTEILARQHAATCEGLAAAVGVTVACLTSGTPGAERRRLQARLGTGEPMLVFGTHALLEEDIRLPNLALAIVDEQHRFGVRQRAGLALKGALPDVLVLTATPIPRTLTLAFYGDLEVSRLASRPPGRGRLVTRIAGEEKLPQVLAFMARELATGHQAFVVVPAIEEGGARAYRAVEAEYERLKRHPDLQAFRVGMLHGRMKSEEKRSTMEGFARGELHVLVSTTVVEVGVDVPNATLMVVFGAEAFGLTQLHQLRGRVGRGRERSVCVLVPGPAANARARQRLQVLAETEDGFAIAEADLKLRGPGEPWGTRQSGLPRLKLADLARDEAVLDAAREAARRVLGEDPQLLDSRHAALRAALLKDYREPLELALAG
jgi:ATP-dependent DNA helicase RecG